MSKELVFSRNVRDSQMAKALPRVRTSNERLNVYRAFLPVLLVSRVLGILPLAYVPMKRITQDSNHGLERERIRGPYFETSRAAKIYSYLFFTVVLSYFASTVPGAIGAFSVFGNEEVNAIQSQFVSGMLLGLAAFCALMDLHFTAVSSRRIRRIFARVFRVDGRLTYPTVPEGSAPKHSRLRRLAFAQMFAVPPIILLRFLVDYEGGNAERQSYEYLIAFYVIRLASFTLEQQFVHVVLILRDRLQLVNLTLKSILTRPEVPDVLGSSSTTKKRHQHEHYLEVELGKKWAGKLKVGGRPRRGSHINLSAVKLKEIRLSHFWVCEEAKIVNEVYQLPLLATILALFFDIISGGYFLVDDVLSNNKKVTSFISSIFWVFQGSLRIGCLSWVAWNTSETAMRAKRYILKMREMETAPAVEDELKKFLDYLLQGKIQFSLCGLIGLDMAMAQAVAQASTSYLLVLLQLRRSE